MILLDTDVLIDVALDRAPHAANAARLLDLLERRPRMAFVAWHTLSNFYYLVSPTRGRRDARDFLVDLTRFVLVAPTDTEAFQFAALLPMPDFRGCSSGRCSPRLRRVVYRNPECEGFSEISGSGAHPQTNPGRTFLTGGFPPGDPEPSRPLWTWGPLAA